MGFWHPKDHRAQGNPYCSHDHLVQLPRIITWMAPLDSHGYVDLLCPITPLTCLSATGKHFLNDPSSLVIQSLQGLCAINPKLGLDANNKVVYLVDRDKSKVALICGGGSGHEPSHAGFVGQMVCAVLLFLADTILVQINSVAGFVCFGQRGESVVNLVCVALTSAGSR